MKKESNVNGTYRIAGGSQVAQGELLKALQVTLNPDGKWADTFKNPLTVLIRKIE